jgi:hypothetical protein
VAWGSSRVVAWGSSRVEASKYVAVHLHTARATVKGGVIIDVSQIDTYKAPDYLDYTGVKVSRGWATVFKAVDGNLRSGRDFEYPIGSTVSAPDWLGSVECGNGLHFAATPSAAKAYFQSATRFLECRVRVSEMVALGDKVKAPTAKVVREVDLWGDPV